MVSNSTRAWIAVAPILIGILSSQVCGQVASRSSMVTLPIDNRDILTVNSEVRVPAGASMGELHVEITNRLRANPADRDLTLVVYHRDIDAANSSFAHRFPVSMPAGQQSISRRIPIEAGYCTWAVTLEEEGRDIEDRNARPRTGPGFQWLNQHSSGSNWGFIQTTQQAREVANQSYRFEVDGQPSSTMNPGSSGLSYGSSSGSHGFSPNPSMIYSADQAHTDWRLYLPYAGWIISVDALSDLTENHPASASALRTYLIAGGLLIIHDVQLDEDPQEAEASEKTAWRLISEFIGGDSPNSPARDSRQEVDAESHPSWKDPPDGPWQKPRFTDRSLPASISRRTGQGELVVSSQSIETILKAYFHGSGIRINELDGIGRDVSSSQDGNWYYRNLISSVGQPPVWTFCVIVVGFATLLGPGLLFITGRIGRRSLMILLVPVLSLAATLIIVLYGILHEGFASYTRVTSVQVIDQQTGLGFAWSRQNYFSSLPPRDGLVFGRQTLARPVVLTDGSSGDSNPRRGVRTTVLHGDRQRWLDWLRPRQQQQLLVGHATQASELPVELEPLGDSQLAVTNKTDATIRFLIFRGADDDYYLAEDVEPRAYRELAAVPLTEVTTTVAQVMVPLRPTAPPELRQGSSLFGFGSRRRWSTRSSGDAEDVIEASLQTHLSEKLRLPPLRVCMVMSSNPAIEVPLEATDSDVNEDLHVVIGDVAW